MSSAPNSTAEPEFGASVVAKPEGMLAGFPWVSAIVLYTLSWGWSLLRPNTLYWDDWEVYFDKPLNNGIKTLDVMGRAPWGGLIEFSLLHLGTWAVTVATFFVFMACSLFLFLILRQGLVLDASNVRLIVLLFLIVPVNHARIAIAIFDYTSSYFLFYLGWFVLVRYKSTKGFVLGCVMLFLSFKTHSFLFFVLLPFLHFVWLNKSELLTFKKLNRRHLQVAVIAVMPVAYILLRELFWPPIESWQDYQQPTAAGVLTGLWPVLIGLLGLSIIGFRHFKKRHTQLSWILIVGGFSITALALFPYFAGELYVGYAGRPAYVTVFEFRADWRSRHQLLMPLGLALSVVGLNELLKWKGKNIVVSFVLVVSVALNMFWGSQYFLMSHKQEQLVELFKETKGEVEIASVADQTLRFNGRESTFRGYEWSGFMTLAGISTDRPGCDALPSGAVLTLKSDTSYLKALATRDLGLYFEVKPCSELVSSDG
jgi:hypothetical protein